MKRIKVLRIIARLNIGGPAIHAILLTEGLPKDKFETLLVCGSIGKEEGDMLYYADEKKVRPYFLTQLKREISFKDDLIAIVKIFNIIKKEKPDIIHTHTAKAGVLGRIAAFFYNNLFFPKKRIKLVHTFHGHVFSGYFNPLKSHFFVLFERFLAKFTDIIITVSDSVKSQLLSLKICAKHKIKVIPLGFELDKFLAIPQKNEDFLNVGIVGRLVPVKNHKLFLDTAARIIREDNIKLKFKIIGDGELRKELESYAKKLGIAQWCEFYGWQKDLTKIYSDLDIVALTSLNEGTPVSLIEAMASARPVIATNVGGIKDLLGGPVEINATMGYGYQVLKRGIMVEPDDPACFARALFLFLKDKGLRNGMGANGRDYVKANFTKQRLLQDMEDLYCKILI